MDSRGTSPGKRPRVLSHRIHSIRRPIRHSRLSGLPIKKLPRPMELLNQCFTELVGKCLGRELCSLVKEKYSKRTRKRLSSMMVILRLFSWVTSNYHRPLLCRKLEKRMTRTKTKRNLQKFQHLKRLKVKKKDSAPCSRMIASIQADSKRTISTDKDCMELSKIVTARSVKI